MGGHLSWRDQHLGPRLFCVFNEVREECPSDERGKERVAVRSVRGLNARGKSLQTHRPDTSFAQSFCLPREPQED